MTTRIVSTSNWDSCILFMKNSELDNNSVTKLLKLMILNTLYMKDIRIHTQTDLTTDLFVVFVYDNNRLSYEIMDQFKEDFNDCVTLKLDLVKYFEELGYTVDAVD